METTTLTIHLPQDVSATLTEKARSNGKDVTLFIEELLERQAKLPSYRDLFAPVRQDFEKSGMSEKELEELIDREVKAVRAERRKRLSMADD